MTRRDIRTLEKLSHQSPENHFELLLLDCGHPAVRRREIALHFDEGAGVNFRLLRRSERSDDLVGLGLSDAVGFELSALFLHHEDYERGNIANAVWVTLHASESGKPPTQVKGQFVNVVETFIG